MKKKSFGRIAAIGLAGLTAVPAISIIASADVTVDNVNKTISGSAYYFTYTVTETTHNTAAQYNADSNTVSYVDSVTGVNYAPATINDPETGGSALVTLGTGGVENGVYYTMQSIANTQKSAITNAVSQANKKQNSDTKAAGTLANFKQQWSDYITNTGKFNKALSDFKSKGTDQEYEDTNGVKRTVSSVSDTNPFQAPSNSSITYVLYDSTTNIETKTMKQISEEVAKGQQVEVTAGGVIKQASNPSSGTTYTVNTTGAAGTTDGTGTVGNYGAYEIPAQHRTASATAYRSGVTWYPNKEALYTATGSYSFNESKVASPAYSSTHCYFDPVNGIYCTLAQKNANYPFAVLMSAGIVTNDETAVYRVNNGLYYHTWSSAYSAAGGDTAKIVYQYGYTTAGNYFSRLTGNFYSTYEAAITASSGNSAYIVIINDVGRYSYYDDPYYYYFLARQQSGNSSSSSSNLGGSSVSIGNKFGWSNVQSYIKKAAAGATLNVSLGNETSIPSEILSALDGKNVTVNFTLKNGSVISFNGQDISSPKNVNVNVTYNTTSIPSALIKKAKSVTNAASSAQVTISSNTFGGEASLTVKFNTNRAGYTAKIYRYNASRNSLQLVDTSTVASNGRVKFDNMTQGGEYVITLTR